MGDKILAPIKQRILKYIDFKGFEKKYFFENLSISSSNFRGESLKSEISGDVIAKILTLYSEINPEWLLTGKGKMIREDQEESNKVNEPQVVYQKVSIEYELRKQIILLEENSSLKSDLIKQLNNEIERLKKELKSYNNDIKFNK